MAGGGGGGGGGKRKRERVEDDVSRDASPSKKKKKKKKRKKEKNRKVDTSDATDIVTSQNGFVESAHHQTTPPYNDKREMSSVFVEKQLEFQVSLLPMHLNDTQQAVEQSFRTILLKYSPAMGGVLLAFSNVKINQQGLGRILHDIPYIHYSVAANVLLFRPTVGCRLIGRVVQESFPSHLPLTVYNYFTASLPAASHSASTTTTTTTTTSVLNYDTMRHQWNIDTAMSSLSSSSSPHRVDTAASDSADQNRSDDDDDDDTDYRNRKLKGRNNIKDCAAIRFVVTSIYKSDGIISMEGKYDSLINT